MKIKGILYRDTKKTKIEFHGEIDSQIGSNKDVLNMILQSEIKVNEIGDVRMHLFVE